MNELRKELTYRLMQKLREYGELKDEEIFRFIDELILETSKERALNGRERLFLRKVLFSSVRELDILSVILEDDTVTEVMVNGPDEIFIEKEGKIVPYPYGFLSSEKLSDVSLMIASKVNRRINEKSPIVDARLEGRGIRVNIIFPPVSLNGPVLTIRRFSDEALRMKDLESLGSISKEMNLFFRMIVKNRYNIFISGGTGSGKTTFLSALSEYIPPEERIITIEDSAELRILDKKNLVRLESRPENLEGDDKIEIRDLIKASLRMRPDRVIVGEVRGKEALDMLQAMNTGHDGSLSTGHANSAIDMLSRIETMVLMGEEKLPLQAIRAQISSAIDFIIHLGRLRDHTRKVLGIYQVCGIENDQIKLEPVFLFQEEKEVNGKIYGTFLRVNHEIVRKEKLVHYEGKESATFVALPK